MIISDKLKSVLADVCKSCVAMQSTVKAARVKASVTVQPFNLLHLDIQSANTVTGGLQQLVKPEDIHGEKPHPCTGTGNQQSNNRYVQKGFREASEAKKIGFMTSQTLKAKTSTVSLPDSNMALHCNAVNASAGWFLSSADNSLTVQ